MHVDAHNFTVTTISSWIFDGIIDVYKIDGIEGLDYDVQKSPKSGSAIFS